MVRDWFSRDDCDGYGDAACDESRASRLLRARRHRAIGAPIALWKDRAPEVPLLVRFGALPKLRRFPQLARDATFGDNWGKARRYFLVRQASKRIRLAFPSG